MPTSSYMILDHIKEIVWDNQSNNVSVYLQHYKLFILPHKSSASYMTYSIIIDSSHL